VQVAQLLQAWGGEALDLVNDEKVGLGQDAAGLPVLISARHERRSLLITANQPFGSRAGSIFPDQAMTVAVVDRLAHHATIFEMNIKSYRRPRGPQTQTRPRPAAGPRDNHRQRLIVAAFSPRSPRNIEQNDEWQLQCRYMQIEGMARLTPPLIDADPANLPPIAA
jgi:hypothetical protein